MCIRVTKSQCGNCEVLLYRKIFHKINVQITVSFTVNFIGSKNSESKILQFLHCARLTDAMTDNLLQKMTMKM